MRLYVDLETGTVTTEAPVIVVLDGKDADLVDNFLSRTDQGRINTITRLIKTQNHEQEKKPMIVVNFRWDNA